MADTIVRDALEVLIVVAVGGMLWSAVARVRAGLIHPTICAECHRPASRAYPACKHCGAVRPDSGLGRRHS